MKRVSAAVETQMHAVLRPDEIRLFDTLNELDNWPKVRIRITALPARGEHKYESLGEWEAMLALPTQTLRLLMRLADARDPAGWKAVCEAEAEAVHEAEAEELVGQNV